jgi:putative redox protein
VRAGAPERRNARPAAVSNEIEHDVEVEGDAGSERLQALVAQVDTVAEIPSSLRRGTPVRLAAARVVGR